MPNQKITDLTPLLGVNVDSLDVLPIVDISANETKKISAAELMIGLGLPYSLAIGNSITGATSGSILFAGVAGVLAQDNANLFWDDTNNRLGIGTNSPTYSLQVNGSNCIRVVSPNQTGYHININNTTYGSTDAKAFGLYQSNAGVGVFVNNNLAGITLQSNGDVGLSASVGSTGVGTTSPTAKLHVKGSGATSATSGLKVVNSSNIAGFEVTDDGVTYMRSLQSNGAGGASGMIYTSVSQVTFNCDSSTGTSFSGGRGNNNAGVVIIKSNISDHSTNYGGAKSVLSIEPNWTHNGAAGGSVNFLNISPIINQTTPSANISRGLYINPTLTSAPDFRAIEVVTGKSVFGGVVRLKGYTVATLPVGTVGDTAYVTDALLPTFLGIIGGGGAVTTKVFYNGANWVAG